MAIVNTPLDTVTHRAWTVGKTNQVSAGLSYIFVERLETDPGTGVKKQKMFIQVNNNGVITEVPLGDSKIPPSVG